MNQVQAVDKFNVSEDIVAQALFERCFDVDKTFCRWKYVVSTLKRRRVQAGLESLFDIDSRYTQRKDDLQHLIRFKFTIDLIAITMSRTFSTCLQVQQPKIFVLTQQRVPLQTHCVNSATDNTYLKPLIVTRPIWKKKLVINLVMMEIIVSILEIEKQSCGSVCKWDLPTPIKENTHLTTYFRYLNHDVWKKLIKISNSAHPPSLFCKLTINF